MILRHCITITTPMGQQILPFVVEDKDLDAFITQFCEQNHIDPRNIKIKTDIELEENVDYHMI